MFHPPYHTEPSPQVPLQEPKVIVEPSPVSNTTLILGFLLGIVTPIVVYFLFKTKIIIADTIFTIQNDSIIFSDYTFTPVIVFALAAGAVTLWFLFFITLLIPVITTKVATKPLWGLIFYTLNPLVFAMCVTLGAIF